MVLYTAIASLQHYSWESFALSRRRGIGRRRQGLGLPASGRVPRRQAVLQHLAQPRRHRERQRPPAGQESADARAGHPAVPADVADGPARSPQGLAELLLNVREFSRYHAFTCPPWLRGSMRSFDSAEPPPGQAARGPEAALSSEIARPGKRSVRRFPARTRRPPRLARQLAQGQPCPPRPALQAQTPHLRPACPRGRLTPGRQSEGPSPSAGVRQAPQPRHVAASAPSWPVAQGVKLSAAGRVGCELAQATPTQSSGSTFALVRLMKSAMARRTPAARAGVFAGVFTGSAPPCRFQSGQARGGSEG